MKKAVLAAILASLLAMAAFPQPVPLIVSAAASLTDVLTSLAGQAGERAGARILFNFGGSGALRRQIEEGAPVDVFASASSADMDRLEEGGLLLAGTRRVLASNSLVLIGTPDHSPATGAEALREIVSRAPLLAIGNPDSVPAGSYAWEALDFYGLLPRLTGRLVLGGSVREVLEYVASGSAPLGIVFETDALAAERHGAIRRLFPFPAESVRTPIVYPAAVMSRSRESGPARLLLEFLAGPEAREAFRRAGFIVP
jgi:molybdate transport system substrate-binding protein